MIPFVLFYLLITNNIDLTIMKDLVYFIKRFWLLLVMCLVPVVLYFVVKAFTDIY